MGGSAHLLCIPPFGASSDISRDGLRESIKPYVVVNGVPGIGSCALRNANPGCSPTGRCCMGVAEQWEPDDARVSRPVLRERGGASPPRHSPFVKINGEQHYLWRAVDHEGEVLESFVTKTRDRKAALKFLRKTMKKHGRAEVFVTDKLRSYGAALRDLGNGQIRR